MIRTALLLLLAAAVVAGESAPNYPIMGSGPAVLRVGMAQAIAANWDTGEWERLQLGSGMTTAQASGNATIATGTTANAETVFRIPRYFSGSFTLRGKVTLSQRIANNNFFVEAVDLIGDGLSCSITNSTTIVVTLPTKYPNMSSADVGKSFTVGVISGAAGVPGRYPIASVDTTGRLVTLTVSGWPASGSCTLSAWGLNAYRMLYTSTTATNVAFDAYRNGYGSGDSTLTINTTASGHLFSMVADGISSVYLDTTTNSTSWTQRGQRIERMPDPTTNLVVQVRALNGTTNPASTTTFTLGELVLERTSPMAVTVQSQRGLGSADGPQAVSVVGNTATNQSVNLAQIAGTTTSTGNGTAGTGTARVTIASDNTAFTVNLGTGGTGATSLGKAEDAVAASGDTGVLQLGVRRDALTTSASAAADYNEIATDRFGAILVRSFEKTSRSFNATSNVTSIAATPTDVWDMFGNGTTTVVITRIRVTGIQTTSGTPEMLLIKRSTASSGGTRVAATAIPLDASDSAASSVPGHYTANPTPGTAIGNLRREYVPIPAAASPLAVDGVEWEFGERTKGLVLSGTAQGIALNLNSVTLTGGALTIEVEWYEF